MTEVLSCGNEWTEKEKTSPCDQGNFFLLGNTKKKNWVTQKKEEKNIVFILFRLVD